MIHVPNYGAMPLAAALVVTGGWMVPSCPYCGKSHVHSSGEGSRLSHCGQDSRNYYVRLGGGQGPALPFGTYTQPSCEPHVEGLFGEIARRLVHSNDRVIGALAMTNASAFGLEDGRVNWAFLDGEQIAFSAVLDLSGDHDDDKPFNGDLVSAVVAGVLDPTDAGWMLADYECVSVQTNADDD